MSWSVLLLSLILNFLFVAAPPQAKPNREMEVFPPASPVFGLLQAVKDGDLERLKTVFSKDLRKSLEKEGWDKVLKTYQKVFEKEFGDYKLEDFTFEYIGGGEEGKVFVEHKSKKLPGLRVIKEQTDWKVNER